MGGEGWKGVKGCGGRGNGCGIGGGALKPTPEMCIPDYLSHPWTPDQHKDLVIHTRSLGSSICEF